MNSTDTEIRITVEQIERMARILSSLCDDVLLKNRQMFGLMAEGPLDEIQKLARQVEEMTANDEADDVNAEPVATNAA